MKELRSMLPLQPGHDIAPISNSSIQPWWDFVHRYRTEGLLHLDYDPPPCQMLRTTDGFTSAIHPSFINSSYTAETAVFVVPADDCSEVCGQDLALLDPSRPNNLLNCGLWAFLASLSLQFPYESFGSFSTLDTGDMTPAPFDSDELGAMLQKFSPLGLQSSNASLILITRNTVSWLLTSILALNVVDSSSLGDGQAPCSGQALFRFGSRNVTWYNNLWSQTGILPCMDAICTSSTLSPDLGGIGVSDFHMIVAWYKY